MTDPGFRCGIYTQSFRRLSVSSQVRGQPQQKQQPPSIVGEEEEEKEDERKDGGVERPQGGCKIK